MTRSHFLAWAVTCLMLTQCSEAKFDANKPQKRSLGSENAIPTNGDGPPGTTGSTPSTDCTDKTEQQCHQQKIIEATTNSHRNVDCSTLDEASCRTAVENTKVMDGREHSEIRVSNCKDFCGKIKGNDPAVVIMDENDTILSEDDPIILNGERVVGQKVQRVGVNFEDLFGKSGNDRDYNDAVLCFTGGFIVNGTQVVSNKQQTVVGETFSASGCNHTVTVEIKAPNGMITSTIPFNSRNKTPINMTFERGSTLEVYMQTIDGKCNRTKVDMHNPEVAVVKPDVCNTTGN